MTYKLVKDPMTGKTDSVKLTGSPDENVLIIPFDDNNSHYVEYKAWVAAGNTPDPAD